MGSANTSLKGKKRFDADVEDMKRAAEAGLSVKGLRVKTFRPGEDEGSIEMSLVDDQNAAPVLNLNLLVSDPSDYPKGHSFFSYCPDGGPPDLFRDILDDLATAPSRPIATTIERLVTQVANAMNPSAASDDEDPAEDDDEDDSVIDYDAFDYEPAAPSTSDNHRERMRALQHDFLECVASGYTAGIVRFSGDDFCVSVSIPVARLATMVPPRALVAWDRRLLATSQHLTLLIGTFHGGYPGVDAQGHIISGKGLASGLNFKVGLTRNYKPSKDVARDAIRTFGLITEDAEDELQRQKEEEAAARLAALMAEGEEGSPEPQPPVEEEEEEEKFDRFSLTSSLESLMEQSFLKVLQVRKEFGLGWAGAELLLLESDKLQQRPADLFKSSKARFVAEDKEERKLAKTVKLPEDPLRESGKQDSINLPLTAYSYLIRRLSLCTRYCLVCHTKVKTEFAALKPYVCDSALCHYQYYMHNRGPSIEYEIIHNPQAVDLLVALAYSAAVEQVLDDPLPKHLGLRVPVPNNGDIRAPPPMRGVVQTQPVALAVVQPDADGLCEFDKLEVPQMRYAIAKLIESLPKISEMRKHLMKRIARGKSKPKLHEVKPEVLPAAWTILRWCVASCRSYLEEITDEEYLIKNIDSEWRQFRFTVGAPDAEARFRASIEAAVKKDQNAMNFPSIFAFHGSGLRNWHSILRHGLWFKDIVNGRAYGHGVYFAKDGSISMSTYAQRGTKTWEGSEVIPLQCTALAEIVNLPGEFVSRDPHLVVANTDWIMCRYLLVRCSPRELPAGNGKEATAKDKKASRVPFVPLDPSHRLTLNNKAIAIPDPAHQIDTLLAQRIAEQDEVATDREDRAIFEFEEDAPTPAPMSIDDSSEGEDYGEAEDYDPDDVIMVSDDEDYKVPAPKAKNKDKDKDKAPAPRAPPKDDWKHNPQWVEECLQHLMPPPVDANPSATMAVQRELRAMLKEQEKAGSLSELGWYMPPDCISDNIFQWIVELHSFDPEIPIAQDMKKEGVNSLIFEIRFPPSFPNAPPFFRIIKPRFLPFIQGGGGHVTGGGSICMDLLTSDGWLPSYSISAVLMQIKLAISNLDPRPARLAPRGDWKREYRVDEALQGYKRAAATHGWTVPVGFEKMLR
ncbi:uncharacterized protein SCHCODRAFT_02629145 [Schizophyllum commune H4-8]|uniref:uncharacterized protein n=1 Tax=Schizophyllum commune (strain H4-8 / FGSC 9210) TaxID=578458 RepID=UPI0021600210|nr:uncharacterized protein SCHCODRAFT_02629145 [Schizophyllum commune H4-8]KAI5891455.1 hypothetical protein SCHCODRAFT_02629145 [Schizophyllum commune H4-8]